MSQELVVGKYEFYPYPKECREPSPTLEELVELREAKATRTKHVKPTSGFADRPRPRRKAK